MQQDSKQAERGRAQHTAAAALVREHQQHGLGQAVSRGD